MTFQALTRHQESFLESSCFQDLADLQNAIYSTGNRPSMTKTQTDWRRQAQPGGRISDDCNSTGLRLSQQFPSSWLEMKALLSLSTENRTTSVSRDHWTELGRTATHWTLTVQWIFFFNVWLIYNFPANSQLKNLLFTFSFTHAGSLSNNKQLLKFECDNSWSNK